MAVAESGPTQSTRESSDSFVYDDRIVRMFIAATLFWGIVATTVGVLVGLVLIAPKMFDGNEAFGFGRLRPVHTNLALFAFVGNAFFAAIYFSVQRLCKSRMASDLLSQLHFWSWQAVVAAGSITLPMGMTQGKEFAEWEWPIDLAFALSWIGFFAVNFFMTLSRRREKYLYVSLWFYSASVVVVGVIHVLNSLVMPLELGKSYSLLAGVQDAMLQWFYGHNLLAFFMIMPMLGLMYYFLPKITGRRVYSYKLAIIHFWSLALLYVWMGPHHLNYSAAPGWVTTTAMIAGLLLWAPSWLGFINGWKTLTGPATSESTPDPVAKKFMLVALLCYGWIVLESTALSLKGIDAFAQYTDWDIATIHVAGLGWCGMLAFAGIYWMIPRLYQTQWASQSAVTLHYWLSLSGLLLFVIPLYYAGVTESRMWNGLDSVGNLEHLDFIDSVAAAKSMWHTRMLGGLLYTLGLVVAGINLSLTWLKRPKSVHQRVHMAPKYEVDGPTPDTESPLAHAPMLEAAKKLDVLSRLNWHRRWESITGRFAGAGLLALGAAAIFQLLPVVLVRGSVPSISTVKPYTPLELLGRDIYVAEGCFNCHSQTVRPLVAETQRYGDFSLEDEFFYDRPFQWGSRRIGPDLAREGGKLTSSWHWYHLDNPRDKDRGEPESVMPSFTHLLDEPIDFESIPPRVELAHRMGAPYEIELTESIAMAKRQAEEVAADIVGGGGPVRRGKLMVFDSQAVALIAYLQRLGTDRFATPDAPAVETSEPQPETQEEDE